MKVVPTPLASIVVAALLASAPGHAREISQRGRGTGVIAGRLVRTDGAARQPAGRISVTLDAAEGGWKRQTSSDDNGNFVFDGLPAGRYGLTASRVGWVTTYYGSPRPGHPPGVRVAVADGARVDVEIPIIKGAAIGGRIVHADGRPMARQFPWLLQERVVGGRKMLARLPEQRVGSFELMTNDLGEFRFFGLEPGTYHIVVTPSIPSGARLTTSDEVRWAMSPPGATPMPAPSPVAGYTRIYCPGTTDPAAALPIAVGAGETRDGVECRIQFVPVARVTGVVRGPDGSPASAATVSLAEREPRVSLEGSTRSARTDAAGQFVLQNVPPGDYRMTVRASSSPAPPAPAGPPPGRGAAPAPRVLDLWGQTDVLVSGRDVDDVAISLGPAATLSGRLVFTGTTAAPPADLSAVRLQFAEADALAAALSMPGASSGAQTATVSAGGTFQIAGLAPGRYIASASWPGMRASDGTTGWWLTTVRVGDRDLGDRPLEVAAHQNLTDITIGFADRIGSVEGTLTDASGAPAPAYFVLAFPVERESWTATSRRMVSPVQTATDGRYRLVGLPPGDYFLAVVTEVGRDDGADPQFLESIVSGALRVTIGAGQTLRQDLRIR
jgi:hypothetical protein